MNFLKNDEKVFINVVCCSRDWRFKGSDFLDRESVFVDQGKAIVLQLVLGTYANRAEPVQTAASDQA